MACTRFVLTPVRREIDRSVSGRGLCHHVGSLVSTLSMCAVSRGRNPRRAPRRWHQEISASPSIGSTMIGSGTTRGGDRVNGVTS